MRKTWQRLAIALSASAALSIGWMPTVVNAQPTPTTFTIGVDNASPGGHNYEYTDFFPRTSLTVHSGDIVNFAWNTGSADGFHTATLLPQGMTPDQAWQANPGVLGPDSDDPGGKVLANPYNPTNPPPGSGAPGACGDAATPCSFDGTQLLSSGGAPTNGNPGQPPNTFAVKITTAPGTIQTYDVVCLIHTGMKMTFTVDDSSPASTATEVANSSASQYQADTAEAQAAEAGATASTTTNADGSHTITAHAGASSTHAEVLEMLPQNLAVKPGDHVNWVAATGDEIHTVTFPAGPGSFALAPFGAECEGPGSTDGPANGPPPSFGCSSPAAAEQTLNPAPIGSTVIQNDSYRIGAADGGVFDFGNSRYFGSASQVHPKSPIVNLTNTPDGQGYYQVGADGGVFTFGDAHFFGSAAGKVTAKVGGFVTSPVNDGYVIVAQDGSTYGFGSAASFTTKAGPKLAAPIVGAATAIGLNGPGGWAVGADGGVFAVGAAPFLGSAAPLHPKAPIVGIVATPDGGGYWLVGADGGVFTFGDARFGGSLGATHLNAPIVGMSAATDGRGYFLVGADGGVFTFGPAAHFAGSTGGVPLVSPINSISATAGDLASSGLIAGPGQGVATSYAFSFPASGTFGYQCTIHFHMLGRVAVG